MLAIDLHIRPLFLSGVPHPVKPIAKFHLTLPPARSPYPTPPRIRSNPSPSSTWRCHPALGPAICGRRRAVVHWFPFHWIHFSPNTMRRTTSQHS